MYFTNPTVKKSTITVLESTTFNFDFIVLIITFSFQKPKLAKIQPINPSKQFIFKIREIHFYTTPYSNLNFFAHLKLTKLRYSVRFPFTSILI